MSSSCFWNTLFPKQRIRPKSVPRQAYNRKLYIEHCEDRSLLAVFTVTNTGDGVVNSPGDQPGTLRQAIFDAEVSLEANDVVNFDLPAGSTIILIEGQLSITQDLTITGPGRNELTIDAGGTSRIFEINDFQGNGPNPVQVVNITGLTLTGGNANQGGAMLAAETLNLSDMRFIDNTASTGGAIFGVNASANSAASSITLTDVELIGNEATGAYPAGYGGAVATSFPTVGSTSHLITLKLDDVVARDNASGTFGGAIAHYGAPLEVENSIFHDNRAGDPNEFWADGGAD